MIKLFVTLIGDHHQAAGPAEQGTVIEVNGGKNFGARDDAWGSSSTGQSLSASFGRRRVRRSGPGVQTRFPAVGAA